VQRLRHSPEAFGQRAAQAKEQRRGAIALVLPRHPLSGPDRHRKGQRGPGHIPSRLRGRVRQAHRAGVQHVLSQPGSAALRVDDLLPRLLPPTPAALTQ